MFDDDDTNPVTLAAMPNPVHCRILSLNAFEWVEAHHQDGRGFLVHAKHWGLYLKIHGRERWSHLYEGNAN